MKDRFILVWTWLRARPWLWLSYFTMSATAIASWIFFFVLNRTKVTGRENIPEQSCGVIFLANHQTMYDSFPAGVSLAYPEGFWFPARPPLNFADAKNFFKWYTKPLLAMLRTVPVHNGRNDPKLLRRLVKYLKWNNLLMFFQGTRSENLTLIVNGPAFAIAHARPTPVVIPVYHEGMRSIFTKGGPGTPGPWRWIPYRLFQNIRMIIGEPIVFDDLLTIPDREEKRVAINDRIVSSMLALQKRFRSTL